MTARLICRFSLISILPGNPMCKPTSVRVRSLMRETGKLPTPFGVF